MLDYSALKRLLVQMLQMPWGSKHSYTDHHETTNSCLLCKATALWFSLATQLLEESERQLEEEERTAGMEGFSPTDGGRPTRLQQQRISMKLALKKLRRLTYGETPEEQQQQGPSVTSSGGGRFGTFPRKRGGSEERGMSPGAVSNKGKSPQASDDATEFDREFPPAEVKSKPRKRPLRKMATVQGESSQPALAALVEEVMKGREEEKTREKERGGEREEEEVDKIQLVFKLCRDVSSFVRVFKCDRILVSVHFQHLKPRLHPDATHKVVQCVMVLVRRCRVLIELEEEEAVKEARALFKEWV